MKQTFIGVAFALLMNVILVSILGLLAMFVWNVGVVPLFNNTLNSISFLNAMAIMTGIYIIDQSLKTYINKFLIYKSNRKFLNELFNKDKNN